MQIRGSSRNFSNTMQAGNRKYVLRKKPPGKVLASAHAVDREYQVMQALAHTSVPVPVARALCTDESVLGTPFYVMDFVQVKTITVQAYLQQKSSQKAMYRDANFTTLEAHRHQK